MKERVVSQMCQLHPLPFEETRCYNRMATVFHSLTLHRPASHILGAPYDFMVFWNSLCHYYWHVLCIQDLLHTVQSVRPTQIQQCLPIIEYKTLKQCVWVGYGTSLRQSDPPGGVCFLIASDEKCSHVYFIGCLCWKTRDLWPPKDIRGMAEPFIFVDFTTTETTTQQGFHFCQLPHACFTQLTHHRQNGFHNPLSKELNVPRAVD